MDETTELIQRALAAQTFEHLMQDKCRLKAVTLITDGEQLLLIPLRLSIPEAVHMMQTACTAIAETENKGELH